MLPGYKPYLNALALHRVIVEVDVPSVYLGVAPFETLENVEGQQFAMTRLETVRAVDGSTIPDGSYFGLPGYGSLVPELEPAEFPYYGEPLGGI